MAAREAKPDTLIVDGQVLRRHLNKIMHASLGVVSEAEHDFDQSVSLTIRGTFKERSSFSRPGLLLGEAGIEAGYRWSQQALWFENFSLK